MPASPPTKYTPELIAKAEEYADGGWRDAGHTHPSKTGLAIYLGISVRTLQKWVVEGEKDLIIRTLKQIEELAPFYLAEGGLKSELNSTMTKLILSNYGVIEKNETALTGKGGGAIKSESKWTVEVVSSDKPGET